MLYISQNIWSIQLKIKLGILLCRIVGRGYLGIWVGHCNGCVRYEFNEKSLTWKTILSGDGLWAYISKYILLYVYIALIVIYFPICNNLKIAFLGS